MSLEDLIYPELERRGWSLNYLGKKIGVSGASLSLLLNGTNKEPRLKTIVGISNTLNIPLRTVVEAFGYRVLNESPEELDKKIKFFVDVLPPDFAFPLSQMRELPVEDQQALLAMLRGALESLLQTRRGQAEQELRPDDEQSTEDEHSDP